jgi:hypothetical protein
MFSGVHTQSSALCYPLRNSLNTSNYRSFQAQLLCVFPFCHLRCRGVGRCRLPIKTIFMSQHYYWIGSGWVGTVISF